MAISRHNQPTRKKKGTIYLFTLTLDSFQRNDIFIEKRKPHCSAYSYWTQRVGLYLSYSGGSGLNTHPNRVGHESFFTLAL